jgi:hypothetical protein
MERIEFVAPPYLKKELKEAAQYKGVSVAEFIKDLIKIAVKEYKLESARSKYSSSDL